MLKKNKKGSRTRIFTKIIRKFRHLGGYFTIDYYESNKDLDYIVEKLLHAEMERDAYKVRYNFLSQHTGLKAYLDGTIEKIG